MNTDYAQFLTPKQRSFCDQYLIDRNACRAALYAGYSRSTAQNGQLMQMPKIQLYLEQVMEHSAAKTAVNHEMLIRELSKVAFANMASYFGEDGKVKPLNDISADDMAAVQSITISPDGTVKIKLCNKMAAMDRIARHLNFYKPQEQQPEKVYIYLDKDDLTEDDTFEDDRLKDEIRADKKVKQRQEARVKAQELRSKQRDELATKEFKPAAEFADEPLPEGIVLVDGAGIPYNAPPKGTVVLNDVLSAFR